MSTLQALIGGLAGCLFLAACPNDKEDTSTTATT